MRARRVDEYLQNFDTYSMRYLDKLMQTSTTISGETSDGFFSNIWIPTRKYNEQTGQLDENYTYYNCGMSSTELADLYWTEYSGNFLIGNSASINIDYAYLETRCSAIFKKNLGKYRHLLELEGLIWNPLWNVDGEEIRQLLENNGTNDVETGQINTSAGVQWNDTKTTHEVTAYDSDTLKKEYEDKVSGNGANIPTGIQRVEFTNGEFTVSNQSHSGSTIASADESTNGVKGKTKYVHNLAKNLNGANEEDYIVDARDTAFGQALKGADKMHVEKLIRHGNIGVTKTTELIEDARRVIAYSIIQQFFDDINEVILVGIWDIPDDIPWYEQSPITPRPAGTRTVNYSRTRELTFDPDGNLVNITFTDGSVQTTYTAEEIAEEREHYGTDVVPLHETLMYP